MAENDDKKGIGLGEVAGGVAAGTVTAAILPRVTTGRNFDKETGGLSEKAQERLKQLDAAEDVTGSIAQARQAAWDKHFEGRMPLSHKAEDIAAMTSKEIKAISGTTPDEIKMLEEAKAAMEKATAGLEKEKSRLKKIGEEIAPKYKEAEGFFTGLIKKPYFAFKGASTTGKIGMGAAVTGATLGTGWMISKLRGSGEPAQEQSR